VGTETDEGDEVSDEEQGFGLVMPFVSVASKGGPYDDDAYAAGWAMGALDAKLSAIMRPVCHEETIRTADLPQADLVAMKHGYRLERSPSEDDEWTFCEFVSTGEVAS
jgi:hypothetical protein